MTDPFEKTLKKEPGLAEQVGVKAARKLKAQRSATPRPACGRVWG
ncbi:ATP synthase protein I [Polaromonas sp. CG9_12]|nr:ATP synthase protein I [Polaromonas sp. CG9_12]